MMKTGIAVVALLVCMLPTAIHHPDGSVQDKISGEKGQRKTPSPQEHYEKRKLLREQFEEQAGGEKYLFPPECRKL